MNSPFDYLDGESDLPMMELLNFKPPEIEQAAANAQFEAVELEQRAFYLMQCLSIKLAGKIERYRADCRAGSFGSRAQKLDTSALSDPRNMKLLVCTYIFLAGMENATTETASMISLIIKSSVSAARSICSQPPALLMVQQFLNLPRPALVRAMIAYLAETAGLAAGDVEPLLGLQNEFGADASLRREIWNQSVTAPVEFLRRHLMIF